MQRRDLFKYSAMAAAVAVVPSSTLMLTGCDTSWVDTAVNDIPTISDIVGSILSIVALGNPALSPEIAAAVNLALTSASAALVTLKTLINDYKTTKDTSIFGKIDAALGDVQTHLSEVLAEAHIKDSALQATISTGISLAISVVSAIEVLIPTLVHSSSTTKLAAVPYVNVKNAVPQKIKVVNSNDVKMMYNVVAASCGYSGQLVK